jgi:hypothetical protein
MAGTDEANARTPKRQTADGQAERASSSDSRETLRPNLVACTIDVNAGRIVKVEKVETTGTRRDLSDEDAANLSKANTLTLEGVIERAFEAGIACVLGDRAIHAEVEESDEEADLRRALLMPLLEKTWARDSLKRDVLGRAIVASAIAQMAAAQATTPEKGGDPAKS